MTALTIALLLMCAAGIGTVYWMCRMIQSQQYVEALLNDTRDQVGWIREYVRAEGLDRLDARAAINSDGDRTREFARTQFALLKNQVELLQEQTREQQVEEHKKTRKDLQELKTRLADEEKQDQRAKRKDRDAKKRTH